MKTPMARKALRHFSMTDALSNLLSRQVFVDSLKTLGNAVLKSPPAYRADGTFDATGWYAHYDIVDPVMHAGLVAQREAIFH